MAEMTAGSQATRQTGHTPHHHQPDPGPEPANPVGNLVTLAGAALSLTLAVGVAVWGYKILMRDVTGVPVVRAMQDEMRVAPDNPGGEIAAHTGLAVNAVPAEGGAAAPEDKLVLAPVEAPLQDEDLAVSPAAADAGSEPAADAAAPADPTGAAAPATAAAPEPRPTSETPARITPASADATEAAPTRDSLSAAEVLALADDIAADAAPLSDLPEGDEAPVQVAVNGVSRTNVVDPGVPGVSNSLRPRVRPASLAPTPESARTEGAEAASAEAAPDAPAAPTLTGPLPEGTKLVQLGAFDSPETAAREWTRVAGRFGDFMGGKSRVIQEAESGGRTFYRLRAQGFSDLSDARRFCAALVAENAPCIPVVVR
jgi:hypothetical protein